MMEAKNFNKVFCVGCDHLNEVGAAGEPHGTCHNPEVWRELSDNPLQDYTDAYDANRELNCKHRKQTIKKTWWQRLCG